VKTIGVTGEFDIATVASKHRQFRFLSLNPQSPRDVVNFIKNVDYYILGGPEYLNRETLIQGVYLKAIAVMGTGTPSFVDQQTAQELEIPVFNVKSENADAVAEFAETILFAANAQIFSSIAGVHQKISWLQTPRKSFNDLSVGLIGMGACGQALARRLKKQGLKKVSYFSRSRNFQIEEEIGIVWQPLEQLMQTMDLLTLHISYNDTSHGLINSQLLRLAHSDLKIFNFSNPRIVDPQAIHQALIEDKISFFYMDGFYSEWTALKECTSPLLALPPHRFIATSHIAAQESSTVMRIFEHALQKIVDFDRKVTT
jgi:phosphoglycerate dehydrogenase-like enzyme